ncbi:importin beta N-terminal domain [Rhizoctonia solani]|uniref:Importin beta N-terminal domain n=1 Tax=Rhizoctonia solani TaxID=456999 RepID=A0A8H8SWL4_9AGAM|nr:importin beta N-terminal domain [Rhizoctonia solani]QRW20489.1 importin beta N-terminal domain [Rhizoctonia solani]
MDPQHVSTLFATTFNADPNVRIAAELELRKAVGQAGMLSAVVQIVGTNGVDLSVRQAAVVFLKNAVARGYKSSNVPVQQQLPAPPVPDADKQVIKQHILPLIVASPNRAIRIQLAAILKTLVSHDFPERWPGFMENVVQLLQSDRSESVFGGMTALLEIFKTYRYRPDESTKILPQIVEKTFPLLVSLGSKAAANPGAPESADFLHLILKTYRNSIQQRLSEHQQASSSLVPWGRLFFAVINVQPPADQIPESLDEREKCPWWKAKKWAYATLNRLFMRYGSPSDLVKALQKQYSKFAQHFATSFAPEILNTYLHQVELNVSGGTWLSKRVTYLIIQFLQQSAKAKTTWQVLKPHIQGLVSSFVFPLLVFTDDKAEAWAADPVEYVRFDIAEFEDYGTPFGMSTVFIQSLATTRTKASFGPMLNFIQSILGNPASTPQSRFGAHRMTACLAGVILEHPDAKGVMESYVVSHVLPEFRSDHAYLRAVACELVTALMRHRFEFTEETNLEQLSTQVVHAFDDPELPVRLHAALALTELIQRPPVQQALKPMIGKVMQGLLKIADETDLDVLTTAMQTFVEQFSEDLVPIAVQLTTRLIDSYMRLLTETLSKEETAEDWDENADKKFAAMGNARTIQTIVTAMEGSKEILIELQAILAPMVLATLEHQALDFFESVFDIMDTLTFSLRQIPPTLWTVFEAMYKSFKGPSVDYLEGKSNLDTIILANKTIIGCKLIEGLMLSLPGQLDGIIAQVITHALNKGVSAKTKILKLHLLNVFVSALLCSPALALHALGTSARPVHDKKLSLLAFCELSSWKGSVFRRICRTDGWDRWWILQLLEEYPKAVENRQKLEEDFNDEEYELDDETHLNMADDDEDVQDEENAYLERLTEESERLRAKLAKDEDSDEDEESDDDDDDYALTALQTANAPVYQAATTSLTPEQATALMEHMARAEAAEREQAQPAP